MMPINGLGQAAIPIVGYNYGAKKCCLVFRHSGLFPFPLYLLLSQFYTGTLLPDSEMVWLIWSVRQTRIERALL